MLFNSIDFLIFFPIVVLFYYIIPKKVRNFWLLIVSYYFYMNWNAKYILLLLVSTIATYMFGLMIDYYENREIEIRKKKRNKTISLVLCLIINLSILFAFKYYNFFWDSISKLLLYAGIQVSVPKNDLLLPVGISFYTFQALSYTIDVYRGEIYAERNFCKYALFVSFFPQLVAGPIERSKNLLSQLSKNSKMNSAEIREGILLMLWGFFLKIMIAERAAVIVNTVYDNIELYKGFYLILATILFAIQIYCDFAGYSVIAMGAAKILGINLMENFKAPYFSETVAIFWRNWHISLSSWFKDYVYIPLGGNQKGKVRKYINNLIVFLLSGLWHGASWTFVLWGGINGLYQIVGEVTLPLKNRIKSLFRINEYSFATKAMKIIFTFICIDFAWIFFRAENIQKAYKIVMEIFTAKNVGILLDGSLYELGLERFDFVILICSIAILFICDIYKCCGKVIRQSIMKQDKWFQYCVVFISFWVLIMFGIYGVEYDAGQFIYFQF